jgi:CubicO group peptidase (beta-lactamase class C family)
MSEGPARRRPAKVPEPAHAEARQRGARRPSPGVFARPFSGCGGLCAAIVLAGLCGPAGAAPDGPSRQVDALVRKYVRDDGPGMAVLVMKDGRVVHREGYGLADLAKKTPIVPGTNFDLASLSKQFTGIALMVLNDRERLAFDDDVRKHLPAMPRYDAKRPIRLRDLLTHTSGLPADYHEGSTTNEAVFKRFLEAKRPLAYPTGSRHAYSNLGYAILALVVEAAGGKPYPAFLREEVFEPLGMKQTVAFASSQVNLGPHALGYELLPQIKPFKEGDPPDSVRERTKPENFRVWRTGVSYVVGDGGIRSNLDDLALWYEAVRNGKLAKAETWREAMTATRLPGGQKVDYGFGWGLTLEREKPIELWHGGGYGGFSALGSLSFEDRFGVLILCNIDGFEHLSAIADGIRGIYLGRKKAGK